MGLILSVKKREKIYVGDDWFRVAKVTGQQDFVVENADGTAYTISGPDDEPAQVIPEVFVSAGLSRSQVPDNQARVFIEAPQEMRILRQGPYRTLCLHEQSAEVVGRFLKVEGLSEPWQKMGTEVLEDLDREIQKLMRGGE